MNEDSSVFYGEWHLFYYCETCKKFTDRQDYIYCCRKCGNRYVKKDSFQELFVLSTFLKFFKTKKIVGYRAIIGGKWLDLDIHGSPCDKIE